MPATTITFKVTAADRSGDWSIEDPLIGSEVNPRTGVPVVGKRIAKSQWTWKPSKEESYAEFGLNFEFRHPFLFGESPETAIGHVVVDPRPLSGAQVVNVYLEPCRTDAGPQLAVSVISGPATVRPTRGQPPCTTPTVDVLVMVDVESLLASSKTKKPPTEPIYMVDTTGHIGSSGGSGWTTTLKAGDTLVWTAAPIAPGTNVKISGFSGVAVTEKYINPTVDPKHKTRWSAMFQPPRRSSGKSYPYTIKLSLEGGPRDLDAFLKVGDS